MDLLEIGKQYSQLLNTDDTSKLLELFWDDASFTDPMKSNTSVEETFGYAKALKLAFPDFFVEALTFTANDERVVIEWRMRGTHTNEFMGQQPQAKSFDVPGVSVLTVVDGKIKKAQDYWDLKLFLDQLEWQLP